MQPPATSNVRPQKVILLLQALSFALLLLLACSTDAAAQGVGSSRGLPGTEGNNTIQGKILFPAEPKRGKRIRIKLDSTNTGTQSTVSDDSGSFVFSGLGFGPYTITIEEGEDYERTIENVSIDKELGGGRNLVVPITLRMKGGLEAGMESVPKPARDLYGKGVEAAKANDSKKAAEHLEAAVKLAPDFSLALNELGVQYVKLGQFDKATEVLEKAIKLAPKASNARVNLGFALLSKKDFAGAETQLREALKLNSSSPTAHMYLGIALMNQKKLDDAEAELLLAVNSKSAEVASAHRYLGGIYWGKRDYKRAADELETYLKLAPKAPDAERTREAIKELRSKQ